MTSSTPQKGLEAHRDAHPWTSAVRALLVNAPFLGFLLYCRLLSGENWYVSYRLPLLGELPNGALTDLALFAAAIVLWEVMRRSRVTRALFLAVAIPLGALMILFRLVDFYYYASTHVPLNAYVLWSNLSMVEEGVGIVRSSIGTLLLFFLVAAHYLAHALVGSYSVAFSRAAERITASSGLRTTTAVVAAAAALAIVLDAHAVLVNPRRVATVTSLSSEYQFVAGLPAFFDELRTTPAMARARRPAQLYLPPAGGERVAAAAQPSARRRPDVFIISVDSFNSLYAAPAAKLNPALTDDVMPFFRSLDTAGVRLMHAYTSSAYTFNGIVSVLCSQYTILEAVWGRDCLPEVLGRAGYDPYAFISIKQLRPIRYAHFQEMGFERDKVFDAIGIRRGKKNVLFDFLVDKELFDRAADVIDSLAHRPDRKPIFAHIATNQMHVPGYFQRTTCEPYPFPPDLVMDAQTRSMINTAHCTDRDLREFLARLQKSGVYDESLIIITADHAFNVSFWTHHESELARVPLFIKLPRSDSTTPRIDAQQLAAHIDIAPTIEHYLGLRSTRPMYGRSLLQSDGRSGRRHVIGISSSHLLSAATDSGLILHEHGQADGTDPALRSEMESLFQTVLYFDQQPGEFERLAREADARVRHTVASAGANPSAETARDSADH
jgi:phosphoglycerol transferase MdoB-like AlkP superfamily enzyme